MKLFFVSAVVAAISTAAFAGQSDRHNNLKLDTPETAKHSVSSASDASAIVFSSRSKGGTKGEGFPYGGFGKGNDSR